MKALFNLRIIVSVFCIAIFASCSPGDLEETQLYSGQELFTSRAELVSLPAEAQKKAWIYRLEMYLSLDLNQAQRSLVIEMVSDLEEMEEGKFFLSESLRRNALAMARITPQDDLALLHESGLTRKAKFCIFDFSTKQTYKP